MAMRQGALPCDAVCVFNDAARRVDYAIPVALIYGDAAGALPCDAVCVFNDAARRVATYS